MAWEKLNHFSQFIDSNKCHVTVARRVVKKKNGNPGYPQIHFFFNAPLVRELEWAGKIYAQVYIDKSSGQMKFQKTTKNKNARSCTVTEGKIVFGFTFPGHPLAPTKAEKVKHVIDQDGCIIIDIPKWITEKWG